jgi:hypothetical protein
VPPLLHPRRRQHRRRPHELHLLAVVQVVPHRDGVAVGIPRYYLGLCVPFAVLLLLLLPHHPYPPHLDALVQPRAVHHHAAALHLTAFAVAHGQAPHRAPVALDHGQARVCRAAALPLPPPHAHGRVLRTAHDHPPAAAGGQAVDRQAVALEVPRMHRPPRGGLLVPHVDVAVRRAGVQEAPARGSGARVAERERVHRGQLGLGAEHDDERVRGAAGDAAPHLYGAVAGAREDAPLGLVYDHGVDRPVVRDEGVDAGAVGELPRLDGAVVGGGVEEARDGVEDEAGDGVAVVVRALLAEAEDGETALGREGGRLLGADVVADGGGADGPDPDVVVAAVGRDERVPARGERLDAAAAHVEAAAVAALGRRPRADPAAVGGSEQDAPGDGQRVHVALQAVQRGEAVVDGAGRGREPVAAVQRRLHPGRAAAAHGHVHPWHGRHAEARRRAAARGARVVLVQGRARARVRHAVLLDGVEAPAAAEIHGDRSSCYTPPAASSRLD